MPPWSAGFAEGFSPGTCSSCIGALTVGWSAPLGLAQYLARVLFLHISAAPVHHLHSFVARNQAARAVCLIDDYLISKPLGQLEE